jgi:hypothetical protein
VDSIFDREVMRDVSRIPRWSHSLDAVHVGSLVHQLHGIWSLASPQSNRLYIICGISFELLLSLLLRAATYLHRTPNLAFAWNTYHRYPCDYPDSSIPKSEKNNKQKMSTEQAPASAPSGTKTYTLKDLQENGTREKMYMLLHDKGKFCRARRDAL